MQRRNANVENLFKNRPALLRNAVCACGGGTALDRLIPSGVDRAIRGFCEDYDRRRRAIEEGVLPPETLGHYIILNAKIDRAIASCCDESFCEEMREDIAAQLGHRTSPLIFLSPVTYKLRKRETKLAIAKALHLL